ncbi:MAG TPA: DUF2269 family protein [Ktedonobacterales bacterium]|nr:DUF2269 family protein [Ktedonobacterales bacterium]
MPIYPLMLFVHIVGVIGTFIGVGVWLFAALALRRAQTVGQVRALTSLIQPSGVLAIVSILVLGGAGFYMAITVWGERATWIIVATISFALLAPFGVFVIDPRLRAVAKAAAAAPDGSLPASLAVRTRDPLAGIGLSIYICVLLGIVYLMTNKPSTGVSIIAMIVASLLGLISGVLLVLAARTRSREDVPTPVGRM